MGFRPKRELYKLDFTGTEYEGLEVTARGVPLAVMLDMLTAMTAQEPSALQQMAATFGYALESWNVEDEDGQPVPADADGLMSQGSPFFLAVTKAWIAAMAGGA
jgi:hypothetical protein